MQADEAVARHVLDDMIPRVAFQETDIATSPADVPSGLAQLPMLAIEMHRQSLLRTERHGARQACPNITRARNSPGHARRQAAPAVHVRGANNR